MVRIVHDDWLLRLGESRPDQSSQTFGGFADYCKNPLKEMEETFKYTPFWFSGNAI